MRTYLWAKDSDQSFAVVRGTITGGAAVPRPQIGITPQVRTPTEGTVRMRGKALSANGFTTPFEAEVTVRLSCLSIWCGGVPGPQLVIAFLKTSESGYQLEMDPCASHIHDQTEAARLVACHRSGDCTPQF